MRATDGLPQFYYDITDNPQEMADMKVNIFNFLDDNGIAPVEEVCSRLDIDKIFDNEVEDLINEWKEKRSCLV